MTNAGKLRYDAIPIPETLDSVIYEAVKKGARRSAEIMIKKSGRPISVLNLFAYTGAATIACAAAGASVCHGFRIWHQQSPLPTPQHRRQGSPSGGPK